MLRRDCIGSVMGIFRFDCFDSSLQICYYNTMRILYPSSNHPKLKSPPPGSRPEAYIIGKWEYRFPGYEASLREGQRLSIDCSTVSQSIARADDGEKAERRRIPRDTAAHVIDWNLWQLSHAESCIDLLAGEVLGELKEKSLAVLGYASMGDFCREEMGISGRLGYELIRNSRKLGEFPLLKDAYVKRKINKSQLRALLGVVEPHLEEKWLEMAGRLTATALRDFVKRWKDHVNGDSRGYLEFLREHGDALESDEEALLDGAPREGSGAPEPALYDDDDRGRKGTWINASVPVDVAALWDYAVEHLRRMEEAHLPVSECVELMLAEYLSSLPSREEMEECASGGESLPGAAPCGEALTSEVLCGDGVSAGTAGSVAGLESHVVDEEARESAWKKMEQDLAETSRCWSFLPWSPLAVEAPPGLRPDGAWFSTPLLMAEKLRDLRHLRQLIAYHQGILLKHMRNLNLQQELMFLHIDHYAGERLGMPSSTARARIRMAETLVEHPLAEKEYLSEALTIEKVRLLGKVVCRSTSMEREWIDFARTVPALTLGKTVEEWLRIVEIDPGEKYRLSPREVHKRAGEIRAQIGAQGEQDPESGIRLSSRNEVKGRSSGEDTQLPLKDFVRLSFFLPGDLGELWDQALGFYREECRLHEKAADAEGFIRRMLQEFLAAWGPSRKTLTLRLKVLERDGYRCQHPG